MNPTVIPGRRPSAITSRRRPVAVTPIAVRGARTLLKSPGEKPSSSQSAGLVIAPSRTRCGPAVSPAVTPLQSPVPSIGSRRVASVTGSPTLRTPSVSAHAPLATTTSSPGPTVNVPSSSRVMPVTVAGACPPDGQRSAASRSTEMWTGGGGGGGGSGGVAGLSSGSASNGGTTGCGRRASTGRP